MRLWLKIEIETHSHNNNMLGCVVLQKCFYLDTTMPNPYYSIYLQITCRLAFNKKVFFYFLNITLHLPVTVQLFNWEPGKKTQDESHLYLVGGNVNVNCEYPGLGRHILHFLHNRQYAKQGMRLLLIIPWWHYYYLQRICDIRH